MSAGTPAGAVVVGVDGSDCSARALDWAAAEAALEARPLVLVHSIPLPTRGLTANLYREHFDALRAESRAYLDQEVARVREAHEGLEVHEVLAEVDPRSALLDASAQASVLVVGSRGLGPVNQLLLGSVSHALVKHADVPVLALRTGDAASTEAGVLVGVAGDDRDDAALELAFRLARARGLRVTLLHCSYGGVRTPDDRRLVPDDAPGFEAQRAVLAAAARAASAAYPGVEVRQLLARGFPDAQLVEESRRAELLVVGHRHRSLVQGLVHGSVAPHVAEHAHCSVAVVPSTAAGGPARR